MQEQRIHTTTYTGSYLIYLCPSAQMYNCADTTAEGACCAWFLLGHVRPSILIRPLSQAALEAEERGLAPFLFIDWLSSLLSALVIGSDREEGELLMPVLVLNPHYSLSRSFLSVVSLCCFQSRKSHL